jgi:lipid A 3-O-deacylase
MSFSQRIDLRSASHSIADTHYLRIDYDNDFFTNNDHYYTQGITIEYANTALKNIFLSKLSIALKQASVQYGLALDLFAFTPTSLNSDSILYGDRPYAAAIACRSIATSTLEPKRIRFTSAIHLGVIGPAALGEEIQTNIHRWTDNKLPKGWQYQIKNDLLLDYELSIEKKWLDTKGFLLSGIGLARTGTVNNKISAGISLMTGHFDDPFKTQRKKKTNYYLFGQGQFTFVGYDATMQGGVFNRNSPYTIPSKDITRITFQLNGGLVVKLKKLFFSYHQSFLTKEFRTGSDHRWGGVSAAFIF